MDYYKIGQRIRKYRKARGLSQEELAERIDISTTHMSHIETGSTKLSLPVLVALAQALEVRTDDLLESSSETAGETYNEIATVLERCNPAESRIIADIVVSVKKAFEKNL